MCWKLVIYVQSHIEQIMQIFHVYVATRCVVYEERFNFLRDIKAKFGVYGLVYNFYMYTYLVEDNRELLSFRSPFV